MESGFYARSHVWSQLKQIKWNLQNDCAFHVGNLCQYKIGPIKLGQPDSSRRKVKVEKIAFCL